MFKKNNVSNYNNFDKPNLKYLKIISIVLAILILICIVLLILGFKKNYNDLSSKNKNSNIISQTDSFEFIRPKNSQLISASLGNNNKLLLRYQHKGVNHILIIDIEKKIIQKRIALIEGKEWEIQKN